MSISQLLRDFDGEALGPAMHKLIAELYPICRSVTGDGVRETLARLQSHLALDIQEVPTGTEVFDWTVPQEWNIRDAYVKDAAGHRVIDIHASNLHVVSASSKIHRWMTLAELRPHLHSLPDQPYLIPYRAAHYSEGWGFCLRHRDLEAMPEGDYEVCIDATLEAGSLTYGECTLPGPDENAQEVLISSHVCHPSLCNDNLSGIAVATFLAELLQTADRSKQYRFVFAPGTICAITWLSRNENNLDNITNGLVLTCLGDPGPMTYKQSRRGDALIDRAFSHVLKHAGHTDCVRPFSPYGYDERQYNSPGFNLPVGCLMRSPCGEFPQYHTSADDLGFVTPEALADSLFVCLQALEIVEGNAICINRKPRGEPRLGKYDVDPPSPHHDPQDYKMALLWVLNLSDGEHDLLQIADRADLPFALIRDASEALLRTELLGQA